MNRSKPWPRKRSASSRSQLAASYRSPKTEVRESGTHGRGLFAAKRMAKGEIVSIRGGHILGPGALRGRRKPPGYWRAASRGENETGEARTTS